jgi:3-phytase
MSAKTVFLTMAGLIACLGMTGHADEPQEPLVVTAVVLTEPLYNYEDAPATPDADDPAIWINRQDEGGSLVIGTAKDAGLLVYNLSGELIQAIRPPNAPEITDADPPTPAGLNDEASPCPESASGETFGRFNNVDVAYDVPLGSHPHAPRADIAVVSDRGCDRIRFYKIDPSDPEHPLEDITAPDVPRVFPFRYDQPSPLQSPPGEEEGWHPNPLDDQNTVYGLTLAPGHELPEIFVSERERGLVRQMHIFTTPSGRLSYRLKRTFLFDTNFELKNEGVGKYDWTPCREAAQEEPQSEGLVFDRTTDTLYVAFETIGLYKLPMSASLPVFVKVGVKQLIEPVTLFGRSYRAIPDDDEFECEYEAGGSPEPGDIDAPGSPVNAGHFLEADLEGLSIITSVPGGTLMLASSQGDSSFHFYRITNGNIKHFGSFLVSGVGDTDGVHYMPVSLGTKYPMGLLVVQNGDAPPPDNTDPINGYDFDGATQFEYVNFLEALKALR